MRLRVINSILFQFLTVLALILPADAEQRVARGEYMVTFDGTRAAAPAGSGYSIKSRGKHFAVVTPGAALRRSAARAPVALDPVQAEADCNQILRDPAVKLCEPVYVDSFSATPNDPGFSQQPNMHNPTGIDINAPGGWDYWTGNGDSVVAIVDSGVNYAHPDLDDNIWINPGETPLNGVDDDGNGIADDIIGYNFFAENNDPWDCNGHGSHVAGIIAAEGDNARGTAGVQWSAKMLIAGVGDCSDSPDIYRDDIIQALDYIADLRQNRGINITVVNISIGGSTFSETYRQAIIRLRNAGIVVVNAAGNAGINVDSQPSYPCSFDLDNIVCVGSVNSNGTLSSFSNDGRTQVDILAPGKDIVSTYRAQTDTPATIGEAEQYAKMSGTSMAAPHVSGAIGLLSSYDTELTYKELIDHLYANSSALSSAEAFSRSGKILDINGILSAAADGDADPTPTPEPTPDDDPDIDSTPVPTPDGGDDQALKSAFDLVEAAQRELGSAKAVLPAKLKSASAKKRKAAKKKKKLVSAARAALLVHMASLRSLENEQGDVLRKYSPSLTVAGLDALDGIIQAAVAPKVPKSQQKALWAQFELQFSSMFGPIVNTIAWQL